MAKKNKDISSSNLIKVKPITEGQKSVFETWKQGKKLKSRANNRFLNIVMV